MKNIFLFTITILFIQCTAQNNIVALNNCNKQQYSRRTGDTYLKDTTNEMDKYVGTWKWAQANKEFTLTLIKQIKHHFNQTGNDNYYEDRLVGYYQYKENGVLIADTSSDDLSQDYGLKVQFTLNCHLQISSIGFEDFKKHKGFKVILTNLTPFQMKMNMYESEHQITIRNSVQIPPNFPQSGSTFPKEMILIKQ